MTAGDLQARLAAAHPDLTVRLLEHEGHAWLELAASIGPIDVISPYDIMLYNIDLVLGQLFVERGSVTLTQTLPLDGIVSEMADETARCIVREAAHLRSALNRNLRTIEAETL